MTSLQHSNEYSIYFRPTDSRPFVIKKCAIWLYNNKGFKSPLAAYNYLVYQEIHNKTLFKYIISEYHRIHNYVTGYVPDTVNIDDVFRSHTGAYGEEAHMYFNSIFYENLGQSKSHF